MPERQFRIQTVEVYSDISRLRAELSLHRQENDRAYNQLRQQFNNYDGLANHRLQAAVEQNRHKSHALALIIDRLAIFMDRSARHVEATDQRISATFSQGSSQLGSGACPNFRTSRGLR